MKIFRKIRLLFCNQKIDTEMADEMRGHLELQTERNIADGMPPEEAHYAAQRQFGGMEQVKELAREQRSWIWLEQLLQDASFAARGLRNSLGFTLVAVLTLAFGIGVNTSMFTALQAILMRELTLPEADRIVQVFRTSPQTQSWPHSPANFLEQQSGNDVFEYMAAVSRKPFNLAEPGQPAERVSGVQVSADIFPLLKIQPELGRVFTAEEDQPGTNQVVLLDHNFWQRRFGGDPAILGRTLRHDGETVRVVGVLPASLHEIPLLGRHEVWRPIAFTDAQRRNRGGNYLESIARLKPGISLARAQAEMDLLAARQTRDHPDTNSEIGLRLTPLADVIDPRGRIALWLTMGLAGFVLLIACANLANLQFARTARRTRELAIRGALGATRGRLLRQLLVENLLIALLGGVLGLVLAQWGNDLLLTPGMSRSGEIVLKLNGKVLGFAFIASTFSGFAFGLLPAWLASRTNVNDAMKQGSRGSTGSRSQNRLQHALIIAQVALALILLAGAGLVVRGLQRFTNQPPGWQIDGLTTASITLPDSKYAGSDAQAAFAARLLEKLLASPGIEQAALASSLPLRGFNTEGDFTVDGRSESRRGHQPIRFINAVTPGYFATLNMRLVMGRDFTAGDTAGHAEVVIINESMARAFWPGESPLGKRINNEEIVGVVNDVRFPIELTAPSTRFQSYHPFAQDPRGYPTIALRGNMTAEALRRVVAELDADLPLNDIESMRAAVDRSKAGFGRAGWLLSSFGVLGLLLASLGIYGVIAGFVAQRTNEIGVRMALGAELRDVLWYVVGKGLRLTLLGISIGLIGAVGISRLLASLATEVEFGDPLAIVVVSALLLAAAMLACWLPARRATKLDPMAALRCE